MVNLLILPGLFFLFLRIVLVGAERIFLTQTKLGKYDSVVVSSLFFLVATLTLLPGLFLIPVGFYQIDNLWSVRFSLLSSLFYAVGFYSYVKALSMEDATLIAPLYNSSLLWLLILSSIFLPDTLSATRILGGIVIFSGFFFLYSGSLKEKLRKIKESKASLLMIFGSMFLAIGRTIDASAISQSNEIIYAISMNLFVGLYLLIIVVMTGKSEKIKEIFIYDKLNLIYAGICNGWAYLFLLLAILSLQVTIAEPASLLSVFITAYLAKKYLGENIEERIPGIVIILLGAFLLFLDKI